MQKRKGRKFQPEFLWEFQEVSLEKMFSKTSNEFSIVCIEENLRKPTPENGKQSLNELWKKSLVESGRNIRKSRGKLNKITDKIPRKSMGKLREANQRERRENQWKNSRNYQWKKNRKILCEKNLWNNLRSNAWKIFGRNIWKFVKRNWKIILKKIWKNIREEFWRNPCQNLRLIYRNKYTGRNRFFVKNLWR